MYIRNGKCFEKSLQRRPYKSSFMFRCESEMASVLKSLYKDGQINLVLCFDMNPKWRECFPRSSSFPWAPPENWFNLPSSLACHNVSTHKWVQGEFQWNQTTQLIKGNLGLHRKIGSTCQASLSQCSANKIVKLVRMFRADVQKRRMSCDFKL